MINSVVKEFEKSSGSRVIYVTMYGSKLFGTDSQSSDTDYIGIFIPSHKSIVLKEDLEHYSYSTNDDKSKNSNEDIDLQLFSIYKWFKLLQKGETGAIDILFSLFREDTQILNIAKYTDIIKENYYKFYNKNLHSFIGYCVGQSKIYNIKGARYKELEVFTKDIEKIANSVDKNSKLVTIYKDIEETFKANNFKYIRFVKAQISRGEQELKDGIYVEVLGKRFLSSVSIEYFLEHIVKMESQFGNRAKASADGIDYKALSHAVRVINEVEELLDYNKITFPLNNREYIKKIKYGHESLESVMNYIDSKLNIVQEKLENSTMSLESDKEFIDSLILDWVTKQH